MLSLAARSAGPGDCGQAAGLDARPPTTIAAKTKRCRMQTLIGGPRIGKISRATPMSTGRAPRHHKRGAAHKPSVRLLAGLNHLRVRGRTRRPVAQALAGGA